MGTIPPAIPPSTTVTAGPHADPPLVSRGPADAAPTGAMSGRLDNPEAGNPSILMQFHQPSRAPLDEVGPDLSDNVVTLMESIWRNPISKDQASQIYGSLPRPANLPCLHKTRINEEIANKLPRHVTDKDSVLGSVQWGLQYHNRGVHNCVFQQAQDQ